MNQEPKERQPDDLSASERILRDQDLWDEAARRAAEDEDITPAQREELERRLAEHERNPGKYATWEEVRRRLEGGR